MTTVRLVNATEVYIHVSDRREKEFRTSAPG
jgi:hypothetical protein